MGTKPDNPHSASPSQALPLRRTKTMITLLRQRNFGLLWWGGLISFIGDWVLFVSLPLYILDLTKSVVAMGVLFLVNIVPSLFLGSVAGVFVDRWDRKRILVLCNLLLGPLYALLLLFDTPSMIWVVYLVGFMGNLIRQLLNPAEMALLPRLVGEGDLTSANALNSLNSNLARLIGPALGGVAFATLGFHASVLIDVATFLVAGLMIAAISAPSSITRPEPHATDETVSAGSKMRAEWLAGIQLIRNSRILMGLFALIGVLNIVDGLVTVLLAVYVKQDLGGGSPELGWLMTAQAVGGLLGSIFVARFIRKLPAWLNIGIGFILFGVLDFFIFGFPVLISNMLLLVAVGIPLMALEVSAITLFQTASEDRFRGRIFGIYGTISGVLLLLGRGIATLIGGQVDVSMLLAVVSLIYIPTGLLAFRLLREPRGSNVVSPARVEEAIPVSAQPTAGA
jgi:MFS family permease